MSGWGWWLSWYLIIGRFWKKNMWVDQNCNITNKCWTKIIEKKMAYAYNRRWTFVHYHDNSALTGFTLHNINTRVTIHFLRWRDSIIIYFREIIDITVHWTVKMLVVSNAISRRVNLEMTLLIINRFNIVQKIQISEHVWIYEKIK